MEINEFIDQDILIFLDDRLDDKGQGSKKGDLTTPTVFLTKDYEKELITALHQDNVSNAKQILHDLKEQLDTAPPGTDRERMKALLLALYDRFKEYIDAHHLSLDDPSLGLKSTTASAPASLSSPIPESSLAAVAAMAQEIEAAITAGTLREAMLAYRRAKQDILTWPSVPNEVALQFIALFMRIKQAAVQHQITPPFSAPAAQSATHLDHTLLLQLEQEKQRLGAQLHSSDIRGAMEQYQRMHLIVQQITDQGSRTSAAGKLQRIFDIITAVKQHSSDRKLARNMP